MTAQSGQRMFRGADAMKDYVNEYVEGGRKFSRASIYRAVEAGKLKIQRLGSKGTEIIAWQRDLDEFIGLESGTVADESDRQAA